MTGDGSEDEPNSGSGESGTGPGGVPPGGKPESGHPDGWGDDEGRSPSGEQGTVQPGDSPQGTEQSGDHPEGDHRQDETEAPRSGQLYCTECGVQLDADAEFCADCGARQRPSSGTEEPDGDKDRIAAALLGIFLGGLGAHRFYLGDIGRGILYLCFSWTLIPVLIGLIEGIIYLTKSDEEFQREHAD